LADLSVNGSGRLRPFCWFGGAGSFSRFVGKRVKQIPSFINQILMCFPIFFAEMLVARIENDNGRVIVGSRITISCEGRGYPQPTVTWEKMGRPLESGGNVYISNTGRLAIRDVTTDDSGVYACIVANEMEKIETSTSVQVVPKCKSCIGLALYPLLSVIHFVSADFHRNLKSYCSKCRCTVLILSMLS